MRLKFENRWKCSNNIIIFELSKRMYYGRTVYSFYLFGFGLALYQTHDYFLDAEKKL